MKKVFAASKNRAMQIRAMENRASRGMPVLLIRSVRSLLDISPNYIVGCIIRSKSMDDDEFFVLIVFFSSPQKNNIGLIQKWILTVGLNTVPFCACPLCIPTNPIKCWACFN